MRSDEDLLRDFARDGSRSAFEEIFRRYGGMVSGVCRRALGEAQEAEDAAQSVFLIFLEKAPLLRRGTILGAWLYRTAVFVSRNRIRARLHRDVPPRAPGSPEDRSWEEAKPHLDEALSQLPRKLQDALIVHYLQGRTLGETATALRCPVKTIEKRVGRGLKRMRELLAGAGVTISEAALVALVKSEAHAAAPAALADRLRAISTSPSPDASPEASLVMKILLPTAVALVGIVFVSGAVRAFQKRDPGDPVAVRTPVRSAGKSVPQIESAGTAATAESGAAAPAHRFPASFDEFYERYRSMRACPEAIERWAALGIELRPGEILRAAGRGNESNVNGVILEIFKEWSTRDPRAATEWLYRACAIILPPSSSWQVMVPVGSRTDLVPLTVVLENWLLQDAGAAVAWVTSLPAGPPRNSVAVELAIVAARQPGADFGFLSTLVDALPPSWPRRVAIVEVSKEWARLDRAAAAAWILKLPEPDPSGPPPADMPTFTLGQPGVDRSLLPFASLEEPVEGEASEGLPAARVCALKGIARSWAQTDLPSACQWSENLPNPVDRLGAMAAIGELWSQSDPAAALGYVRAHPGAEWRFSWLSLLALRLAPKDRAGAEAIARQAPEADRAWLLDGVIAAWGENRPDQAAPELLRALSQNDQEIDEGRYCAAVLPLVRAWARKDPRAAAAWAASVESEKPRHRALSEVAREWSAVDARATLDWAATLPSGPGREYALGESAIHLAAVDLRTGLEVADQLPPGWEKWNIRAQIGGEWGKSAPELALAWACAIAPDEGRDECIRAVLGGWAEHDPDAARAHTETIIDGDTKAQALKDIDKTGQDLARRKLRKALLGQDPK